MAARSTAGVPPPDAGVVGALAQAGTTPRRAGGARASAGRHAPGPLAARRDLRRAVTGHRPCVQGGLTGHWSSPTVVSSSPCSQGHPSFTLVNAPSPGKASPHAPESTRSPHQGRHRPRRGAGRRPPDRPARRRPCRGRAGRLQPPRRPGQPRPTRLRPRQGAGRSPAVEGCVRPDDGVAVRLAVAPPSRAPSSSAVPTPTPTTAAPTSARTRSRPTPTPWPGTSPATPGTRRRRSS